MPRWSEYQEEVADFFRSLGLAAVTNERIEGVRTKHEVDVVVRSKHAGFDVLWLVECKAWRSSIPKEKVLALRAIVDDAGSDRGFIMAESGYQPGALEASRYANVVLTSLVDLKETLSYEIGLEKLRSILDRAHACSERYWAISKSNRIICGLRPQPGAAYGYRGRAVVQAVEYTAQQALLYGFPIRYERMAAAQLAYSATGPALGCRIGDGGHENPLALYDTLDGELRELEERLDVAECAQQRPADSGTRRLDAADHTSCVLASDAHGDECVQHGQADGGRDAPEGVDDSGEGQRGDRHHPGFGDNG